LQNVCDALSGQVEARQEAVNTERNRELDRIGMAPPYPLPHLLFQTSFSNQSVTRGSGVMGGGDGQRGAIVKQGGSGRDRGPAGGVHCVTHWGKAGGDRRTVEGGKATGG
jgi:hypothetical protein